MVNSAVSDGDPRKDGLITRCVDARWTRARVRLKKTKMFFSLSPVNEAGISDTKHTSQGCLFARVRFSLISRGVRNSRRTNGCQEKNIRKERVLCSRGICSEQTRRMM